MTNMGDEVPQFYTCNCFTTDNIFLEDYKLHVRFESDQQFRQDYQPLLMRLGCVTDQQFEDVLNKEAYVTPKLKQIVQYCRSSLASEEGLLEFLEKEAAPRVYRFPVFEKSFCEALVEELEHFEQSSAPKGRPNTMNHYGILLNELGFDESFITPLREQYLHPLTSLLFPDCGGHYLDSHKAFVVKYDMNEDLDLSYHYDNAEVTLNVSLGKEFTEGNLYFGDMRQVPVNETECTEVEHRVTEGLLHRGQHMHGALPISQGQRWNLIIWMRASPERNKLCPMCNRKPSLVVGEGFADGFTKHSEASCVLT
ncbi:2-oxoglutarate and iron-dependent oxygenase domain-containing protein 2 isoform X2 [Melanotaenia boesemani]|uniref:2-oxoglutarate and iron-dependent oxygenase domain-containing protein 2 isoform X2 n=1 Tax=Melanotaenia boesemani TaxID=1250792 RepID=UPI001C05BFF1|nr:2-oxoglutarate and iron-dependent oxygenase domain-containing protein 2 isoform X2 [Melanotaenia boesemani]